MVVHVTQYKKGHCAITNVIVRLPSWICNESQPRSNLRSTKENRKAVFRVPVPSQLAMSAYVRKV
eukprot:1450685-Pyramimonas_sp.AAC.1